MNIEQRICDVCGDSVGEVDIRYAVERHDTYGYYDTLDVCGDGCLAMLAVGQARERGERYAEQAAANRPAPEKRKRWWQR